MSKLEPVRMAAADVFGVDPKTITASTTPEQIETWDSVQHLNLVMALETTFGIEFEPEEIDQMKSIGDIASLVEAKAG